MVKNQCDVGISTRLSGKKRGCHTGESRYPYFILKNQQLDSGFRRNDAFLTGQVWDKYAPLIFHHLGCKLFD
jgi:hypothetical protein